MANRIRKSVKKRLARDGKSDPEVNQEEVRKGWQIGSGSQSRKQVTQNFPKHNIFDFEI